MTESLGEFNSEQLDRARARSVSGGSTSYIDDLEQEKADLRLQLEVCEATRDRWERANTVLRDQVNEYDMARNKAEEGAKHLQAENERLRKVVKDLASACIAAGDTLDSVDPNAPSREQVDQAIGKHWQVIGPMVREATNDPTN